MSTPKITLAMIVRDRADSLRRALISTVDYVDEIIIVLAGRSKDDTEAVAREFGATVIPFYPEDYPESFYEDSEKRFSKYKIPGKFSDSMALGDFSAARNLSFEKATGDFIFWIDSDDLVIGAEKIRGVVEKMVTHKIDTAFFEYEYEHDSKGNVTVRQIRERIVKRGTAKWIQPIHEHMKITSKKGILFHDVTIKHERKMLDSSLVNVGGVPVQVLHTNEVAFRNLKNLIVWKERLEAEGVDLEEDQDLFRIHMYLGTEYRSVDLDLALHHMRKYIERTPWDEERAHVRCLMGHIKEVSGHGEEAFELYAAASVDFPQNPSSFLGMARVALVRGNPKAVVALTERAFAMMKDTNPDKLPLLSSNPFEYRYRAQIPYVHALMELNEVKKALAACEEGLSVVSDCPYLTQWKKQLSNKPNNYDEMDGIIDIGAPIANIETVKETAHG